jgi:hypothetical protein
MGEDSETTTPTSVKAVQIPAVTSGTRNPGSHTVITMAKTYRNVTATPSGVTRSRIKIVAINNPRSVQIATVDQRPSDAAGVEKIEIDLSEE